MLNLESLGDEGDGDGAEDNSAEGADSSNEESADDSKSDEGAESKVVSFEDYLRDNPDAEKELEKRVQAGADKRFENKRRRDAVDTRRASERANASTAARERAELADKGDFEELGKRTASDDERKTIYNDAAQDVAGFIEQTIRDNPEVADALGDDKLAEITAEVRKENGDVTDFVVKVSAALGESRVGKAMEDQKNTIKEEVEAALKARGMESRTDGADEGANEDISKSTGGGGTRTEFAEIQDKFIAGTISSEAYEKAEIAHNERTQ